MDLNKHDKDLIARQDPSTLAQWWCALNRWQWPNAIPGPEAPTDWQHGRRTAVMKLIVKRIGKTACLDEWRCEILTETAVDEALK